MLFHFCLMKSISYQWYFIQEVFFISGFHLDRCFKIFKLSSLKPLVNQIYDAIILIKAELKRRLINPKIQVFKVRYFLNFDLKLLFKQLYYFRKGYLVIISIQKITSKEL